MKKWIETNTGNIIITALLAMVVWNLSAIHAQGSRIDAANARTDAAMAAANTRSDQIMAILMANAGLSYPTKKEEK